MEVTLIPLFHEMLEEIYATGDMSPKNQQIVFQHLDKLDARAAERLANLASALRESKGPKP